MSKAVKAVTGAVSGIAGSIFGGGGSSGIAGTGSFKASTRPIDKKAFEIKEADKAAGRARELETSAQQRSQTAVQNRQQLIQQLQGQAEGTAPSLAEAQLRSAADRSLAQQLAAAQSQRGGSAASRERQLMQGQAQAGREVAQDATQARLQERQLAQQLLGEQISQEQQLADQLTQNYLSQGFTIEQARQQALQDYEKLQTDQFLAAQGANLSGFQSAAANRAELFGGAMGGIGAAFGMSDERSKKNVKKVKSDEFKNMAAEQKKDAKKSNIEQAKTGIELAKKRRSDEEKEKRTKDFASALGDSKGLDRGGKAMGYGLGQGMKALFSDEDTKTKKESAKDLDFEKYIPAPPPKKEKKGMDLAALAKIAPALQGMSDENSKKDMKAYSDKNIKKDFLDKLEAYTYEYKNKFKNDPRAGEGRHMSVMAQDLEKAGPLGKNMVLEDENGVKMVDYAKGYGAILAAQAHLNKRLEELEKKKKR